MDNQKCITDVFSHFLSKGYDEKEIWVPKSHEKSHEVAFFSSGEHPDFTFPNFFFSFYTAHREGVRGTLMVWHPLRRQS